MNEINMQLTSIPTPKSQNIESEPTPVPATYVVISSSVQQEVQVFHDLAELNNRIVTLARQCNMSIEELLRNGLLTVVRGYPVGLRERPVQVEVIGDEPTP